MEEFIIYRGKTFITQLVMNYWTIIRFSSSSSTNLFVSVLASEIFLRSLGCGVSTHCFIIWVSKNVGVLSDFYQADLVKEEACHK